MTIDEASKKYRDSREQYDKAEEDCEQARLLHDAAFKHREYTKHLVRASEQLLIATSLGRRFCEYCSTEKLLDQFVEGTARCLSCDAFEVKARR